MNISTDLASGSVIDLEETLSDHEVEDLDKTLPYSYDVGYRIEFDAQAPLVRSSDSESDLEPESDHLELLTHKFIQDRETAPFSTSFVEEERDEGVVDGEEVEEVEVGATRRIAENQEPKVSPSIVQTLTVIESQKTNTCHI